MKDMQRRIFAIYQANPQASRLDVLRALGLESPSTLFDDQLVQVQQQLRGKQGLPSQRRTKGPTRTESYGFHTLVWKYRWHWSCDDEEGEDAL